MRKKKIAGTAMLLLLLCAAGYFVFSRHAAKFSGDRVVSADPPRFYLRFDSMNAEDSETLTLPEGSVLRVSWQIESGSVDLLISMAGEAPLYRANGRGKGDSADFELTIPRSGDYTVSVSARKAKGQTEFARIR